MYQKQGVLQFATMAVLQRETLVVSAKLTDNTSEIISLDPLAYLIPPKILSQESLSNPMTIKNDIVSEYELEHFECESLKKGCLQIEGNEKVTTAYHSIGDGMTRLRGYLLLQLHLETAFYVHQP